MLAATLLTLLAAGPPATGAATLSPACTLLLNSPTGITAGRRGREELRAAYRQALNDAARRNNPDPLSVTPGVLLLFWELDDPESMPPTERGRMRRALKSRLQFLHGRLVRERIEKQRELRRARYRSRNAPNRSPGKSSASNPGGAAGAIARANELIDLIQNTIAPETWAVNGGRGTISFLGAPFYVLVIRNSARVHHQIGGVLPAVRR